MAVRVKICGVTSIEDAELAWTLGADALGFNFYPASRRYLSGDIGWLTDLPPYVTRVAVLVNDASLDSVARWRGEGFVDSVQLHGDETPEFCQQLVARGVPITRALRVQDEGCLREVERWGTRSLLLDAYNPGAYGGTGERLDWGLAAAFVSARPDLQVVLSGGLTPANVAEAVRTVRPFAVDVASGVEDPGQPRRKDPARLRDFIQAAKGA